MIIDYILDRKEGCEYDAHDFYIYCLEEEDIFEGLGHDISEAMDYGTNKDVQKALCNYIDNNEYNPEIKKYINSVDWVEDDECCINVYDADLK